jgi:DMSO reductase anchor subunit
MKPSFSLIVFTVLAGAGYGLFMLSVAHAWFAAVPLSRDERSVAVIIALLLVITGLGSSVLHLANKRNGWKAFSRIRTSWLSREAAFSVIFFAPAVLYLAGTWPSGEPVAPWIEAAGVLGLLLALATVFSTGMIYASLKTIRQWHSPLVPVNYVLLALASGGVLLSAIRAFMSGQATRIVPLTLVLLGAALLVKLVYYFWIGKPAGTGINTALAMPRAQVRLLDVGHSHGTFLTEEFGRRVPRLLSWVLRGWVIVAVYLVPLALLPRLQTQAVWALAAVLVMLAGLLTERWLFLAEGQHVVNLYHGRQRI